MPLFFLHQLTTPLLSWKRFFQQGSGPLGNCHGISAASGNVSVSVGVFGLLYLSQNQEKVMVDERYPARFGVENLLIALAVFNALGFLFTFLVPESEAKVSGVNEGAGTEEQM